jgi:quercetin dioxygenase-like cupin family protein
MPEDHKGQATNQSREAALEALAKAAADRVPAAEGQRPMNGHKTGAVVTEKEQLDLATLVDYAEGSIVSRTLSQSDERTVTLFAFDAGQNLSEHTAPFDAFVQVLDGEAELTIGGKPVVAAPDSVVLMPADVPHAVNAAQRFKMLLIMVRPE